jgi:glycosyltransferase involved in cell wall biosynthesis
MTFLLLNQTFHPDLSATGQYLSDLARSLVQKGHEVTVITARSAYDSPRLKFPRKELWHGVSILRVASTGFGKKTKCGRVIDAVSFLLCCILRLFISPRPDVLLVLSSPPLIPCIAACFACLRRCKLCYWVMDFNPDEAIAAGWLHPNSFAAKVLHRLSLFSFQRSAKVIALDRFMRERIVARGAAPEKIAVIPLWSRDNHVSYDPSGRDRFRADHGLARKFVVMYSGNHSPCHPLDSLVSAAESLAAESDISFCFVGGGTEWHRLPRANSNMLLFPYQPMDRLSATLSAADLHVMVMGDPFVGLVHPCKLYNLLKIGVPLLYIGPPQSHVTDLLLNSPRESCRLFTAKHGEVQKIAQQIRNAQASVATYVRPTPFRQHFSQTTIVKQLIETLEAL